MLNFIYACFESAWRRCFGNDGWNIPVLKNRAVQHALGFVVSSLALVCAGYGWLQSALCACVLQFLFWAKGHGMCFDFGHGEVDKDRYEEMLSWRLIKKYIPKKMWYGYNADFVLMATRYTIPAAIMGVILLSPHLFLLGAIVAGIYALFWSLYDLKLVSKPTELAEYAVGFITGIMLVI